MWLAVYSGEAVCPVFLDFYSDCPDGDYGYGGVVADVSDEVFHDVFLFALGGAGLSLFFEFSSLGSGLQLLGGDVCRRRLLPVGILLMGVAHSSAG